VGFELPVSAFLISIMGLHLSNVKYFLLRSWNKIYLIRIWKSKKIDFDGSYEVILAVYDVGKFGVVGLV